jgi:hypothetical protein
VERRVCDPCHTELNNEVYESQDFIAAMKERGAVIRMFGCSSKFGKNGFFKKHGNKVSDKFLAPYPSPLPALPLPPPPPQNGYTFYSPVLEPDDANSIFHIGKEWWHGSHSGASTPHVGQNGHVASNDVKPPTEGWSHKGSLEWI